MQFKALQMVEDNHLSAEKALPLNYIASVYFTLGNYPKAISYYRQAMVIEQRNHKSGRIQKMNMGNVFEKMDQLDSALYYEQLDSSIYYARKGLEESELTSYKQGILDSSTLLSELYERWRMILLRKGMMERWR